MNTAADARTRLITQLDARQKSDPVDGNFQQIRLAARERLETAEFPTLKDEDWKYTSLRPFFNESFHFPPKINSDKKIDLSDTHIFENGYRLVFIDGQFVASLSHTHGSPENCVILPLSEAIRNYPTQIENILSTVKGKTADIFSDLAGACLQDGIFIQIPRNLKLDKPIQIVFFSSKREQHFFTTPRILVHAESGSEATIVEHFAGQIGAIYHSNPVTQILLESNARVSHYQLGFESNTAFHVSRMAVHQRRDSQFNSWNLTFGGRLVRHDIDIDLPETGSVAQLNGLSIAQGEQHIDNQTFIDHTAPHTSSRENYRSIVDNAGHTVFTGQVLVRPNAQKTDAHQVNKNLLLSTTAQADTRPQLEIFADDVKASHGATVGQLDENQIFYLRARGIGVADARQMLTHAFANEIVQAIPNEAIRNFLNVAVQKRLGEQNAIMDAE